ncbi:elongation of very long chain fatty acids protein 4-like [Copidosoma floridanum]|uniref:elongation of very long chain fatty acids protein 4-like n=1 Tax=Copidosoma floridanum TaxID=29053 RepID=UPI0006C9D938|nr:elongation of very long chain fatty acids protein 4-like [Copidosoma floridanum]
MDIVKYFYDSFWETEYDERTIDWWPVKHQWLVWTILASYLYFVKRCGPRFMEKRRPYSFKTFIKYYNIFQIIYNAWIIYACIKYGLFHEISLGCEFVNKSPTGNPMELAKVIYWTFMLKVIDLIETVIFVLRKKNRQISFLHLYHHASTIAVTHISVKHYPGGMVTFPIVLNSTVHVIMYTYYLLSSQGPKVQKIINPIKPYITIIQMVQFFILLAHTVQGFFPYCHVPRWGVLVMFANLVINFTLFFNFYIQNYKKPVKPKKS